MTSSPTYHVATLSVPAAEADLLMGRLYELGCLGLEEKEENDHTVLKTYFEDSPALDQLKNPSFLGTAKLLGITTIGLGDWTFRPASFEPFTLGPFTIAPPSDLSSAPLSKDAILIRPGPAFGTGRHTTTRLVAEAFLKHYDDQKHRTLLDVGTGSGILAILVHRMGVTKIAAVDISSEAIENARENFRLNGAAAIDLGMDVNQIPGTFDIVLGNLLTPTLLYLKETLIEHLAPGGLLIVSGITQDEADGVRTAYANLDCLAKAEEEEWACFVFQKHSE